MSKLQLSTDYWKLWSATAVSNLGDGVALIGAPLLATLLTREPVLIAGLAFAQRLPGLVFALVSGAVVDRLDRRRVMSVANGCRTVVLVLLGVAILGQWVNLPLLYGVVFLLGTAETLFDTASQTLLPDVVPQDDLETANGRLYAAELVTNNFAGPPLGGFLFGVLIAAPFLVGASAYAVTAVLVMALHGVVRSIRVSEAPRAALHREIGHGLRWLFDHRLVRTLAIMVGLMNMLSAAAFATWILYVQDVLGLSSTEFGWLRMAGAVGGLGGTVVASGIIHWLGQGRTLVTAFLCNAVTFAVIVLLPVPAVAGGMLALSAFTTVIWNVITVSFRQAVVPEQVLGRVNSAYRLLAAGGTALGALLGGMLTQRFGLTTPFWVAAVLLTLTGLVSLPVVNERTLRAAREDALPEHV